MLVPHKTMPQKMETLSESQGRVFAPSTLLNMIFEVEQQCLQSYYLPKRHNTPTEWPDKYWNGYNIHNQYRR